MEEEKTGSGQSSTPEESSGRSRTRVWFAAAGLALASLLVGVTASLVVHRENGEKGLNNSSLRVKVVGVGSVSSSCESRNPCPTVQRLEMATLGSARTVWWQAVALEDKTAAPYAVGDVLSLNLNCGVNACAHRVGGGENKDSSSEFSWGDFVKSIPWNPMSHADPPIPSIRLS